MVGIFRKKLIFFLVLIAILFVFSGCRQETLEKAQPMYRIVTAVDVTYESGPNQVTRHYTSPEKMESVLTYLRLLDPWDPAQPDPDHTGSTYHIVLSYSDGNYTTYHQKADLYLQKEGQMWKEIDPEQAVLLGKIIQATPSDL